MCVCVLQTVLGSLSVVLLFVAATLCPVFLKIATMARGVKGLWLGLGLGLEVGVEVSVTVVRVIGYRLVRVIGCVWLRVMLRLWV
jgi:hypothetical protein